MKDSSATPNSIDLKYRQLDIREVEFNSDGIKDFYWPLDTKRSAALMSDINKTLIPFITQNQDQCSKLLAIRLLFKWFICEVLQVFEATVLVQALNKDGVIPLIPKHYKKLDSLYNSEDLDCNFFLDQSAGPSRGRKINPTLKRYIKELKWNGLKLGLCKQYGLNNKDILAISPSDLAIQHAKGTNKLLRCSEFIEWFDPIPKNLILKECEDLGQLSNVMEIVEQSFARHGCIISSASHTYILNWTKQANNFVNYYLGETKKPLKNIKSEVWFSCGGATVWHVILIEKFRRKGIKVVTHDHGSGNSHHDQTSSHWVEFMHTDHFITFNQINEKNKRRQFNSDLIFGQPDPLIQSLDTILGDKVPIVESRIIKSSKRIKKIMYVGTAFHGEGTRLRPIFHDLSYLDWQAQLLSHLRNLNVDLLYKPHPEGYSVGPVDFAESFGFRTITKPFEKINEEVDAYVIDFIFSSTTPAILKTDKPVFFINLGFPELLPEALELIKKRCYYLEAEYSSSSRLSIDFEKFDKFMMNSEHEFNTSFSDLYFRNT